MAATDTFTVDTHIFRELGALLVGRDSTALSELVKNAYDADASLVEVYGENVGRTGGFIRIKDNGHGMGATQFREGFLRIASRLKDESSRYSPLGSRRMTGAKGIGRLAAHKLAAHLEIESHPRPKIARAGVHATIDWDLIENKRTLDEIPQSGGLSVRATRANSSGFGTTITLTRLRGRWQDSTLRNFIAEVQSYEPPELLAGAIPSDYLRGESLLGVPLLRDTHTKAAAFSVQLSGDFAPSDYLWETLLSRCFWLLEIEASSSRVTYRIVPMVGGLKKYPSAKVLELEGPRADRAGPEFAVRILTREGPAPAGSAPWIDAVSGVRVYMEGFRVLPYGEPGNDWLGLDSGYARRRGALNSELLEKLMPGMAENSSRTRSGLSVLPSRQYLGAVFLTEAKARGLQMLVNREGFLPTSEFAAVSEIIQAGLALLTRHRAASLDSEGDPQGGPKKPPSVAPLERSLEIVRSVTRVLAQGHFESANEQLIEAIPDLEETLREVREVRRGQFDTLILASVGLQMAAFTHELTGVVTLAKHIESGLQKLRDDDAQSRTTRRALAVQCDSLVELRRGLERQAAYLVDVTSAGARTRRSRQKLRAIVDSAMQLVAEAARAREVRIENNIPEDLRTPAMYRSELVTILTNLLTNAIKAAGQPGRITIMAEQPSSSMLTMTIANTGIAIDLRSAERWFRPYESTTVGADPVLGQGMGLGLPITRILVEARGGAIQFVRPPAGFKTAVEVRFGGES